MLQRRTGHTLAVLAVLALLAGCSSGPATSDSAAVVQAGVVKDPDQMRLVATTLTRAALIKPGDIVAVSGSVRDAAMLEDIAIDAMKQGGQPIIAITSDQFARRSYTEVPTFYDTLPPNLGMAWAKFMDVDISIESGESDSVMAGIPAARIEARAKRGQRVNEVRLSRGIRSVNLGNGLYPTAALAT